MHTTHRLIKIGNSIGIVIPKLFLEGLNLRLGDLTTLEFDEKSKKIILKPRINVFIYDPQLEFN
ncbi:MAG: AbrB/MazE/SpoVT family DNA-binding domain-containing protein, partial [Patescibacteria group bacterium]